MSHQLVLLSPYTYPGAYPLTLADEDMTLESGDSVTIRAGVARRLSNATATPVRILIVSMSK